jgi:perosamine synthetase
LLAKRPLVSPLHAIEQLPAKSRHAFHLYVVRLAEQFANEGRNRVLRELRTAGIGANVHYIPVHLQPYYQQRFGTKAGDCPVAEKAFSEILTLPMFPGMSDDDVRRVCAALQAALQSAA